MAEADPARVFISWSHTDPGTHSSAAVRREQLVRRLDRALRDFDFTIAVDLHEASRTTDWITYGPKEIAFARWIVVVLSEGWIEAWNDDGDHEQRKGSWPREAGTKRFASGTP